MGLYGYKMVINLEMILGIVKNPEQFLLERDYRSYSPPPKGFRLELFVAKQFTSISNNLKQYSDIYLKRRDCDIGKGNLMDLFSLKSRKAADGNPQTKRCKPKTFCQYCEKLVIPKRLHKLDYGDILLSLFTGGFWIIFIFVIYMFLRKCPFCNNSLRGIKPQKR
ncbi:MAG: hypothetical protein ACUZ8O_01990 [Candidatus Anammoxibacter sp.]